MADKNLLVNSPFINYFHYSTGELVGKLLDAGTIDFFEAEDHTVRRSTFSDPAGSVVNPNPIVLNNVGSAPIIYMQNAKYYIVIKDKFGNVVKTYDNYIPNSGGGDSPIIKADENYITNGQFEFTREFLVKENDKYPTADITFVAAGWEWWQDHNTTTKTEITFENVSNISIESNPLNEIVINSFDPQSGETTKALRQLIGNAQTFENETMTFSLTAINKGTGTTPVQIKIYKNYGSESSTTAEMLTITTFNVDTSRKKYSFSYTFPGNAGKDIKEDSALYFVISFALNQNVKVGLTNVMQLKGTINAPVYPEMPLFIIKAKAFAAMKSSNLDFDQGYYPVTQLHGGTQEPFSNTGLMAIYTKGKQPVNALKCDGRTLKVSDNTIPTIRNRRLFNVIGKTFGGGGDLVVAQSGPGSDTIKFDLAVGGREKTAYTVGNLGTKITLTNTIKGLKGEVKAVKLPTGEVECTFLGNYTPIHKDINTSTYCGYDNLYSHENQLKSTDHSAGPPAVFRIDFLSKNISDYKTGSTSGSATVLKGVLGWNTPSSDVPFAANVAKNNPPDAPSILVTFKVDGKLGLTATGKTATYTIPFKTSLSLDANKDIFVNTINNPFEWTIKFNQAPAASQYFEYSSDTVDYYAWYKVDGVGTDPAIAGRSGREVQINSTDTNNVIAKKTADALNSLEFNLPNEATPAHGLPAYQGTTPLVGWYITL